MASSVPPLPGEPPREESPTTSDRRFREFLELQEREGHSAAIERFRREHPDDAARLGEVLDHAAVLEGETVSDGAAGPGGVADARLSAPLAGRYRIERFLARGGMGDVYLGTDTRVDALVAIKVFHRAGDGDLRARFLREARVGGRLSHRQRGTARVHDLDELDDGTPFLVMEYVEGRSLAAVLSAGPLAPRVVCDLVVRLADTLAAIHGDGVVHCDLKPSNILVRALDGGGLEPVLIDFGVARVRGPLQVGPETRSGEFRGTMSYAAPESLDGHPEPASDQYALAVLAWEALTGRRAFPAEGLATLIDDIRARRLPPADRERSAVPEWLGRALERGMAKRPAERFESIAAFARAVAWREGARPAPSTGRRRVAAAVAGAALLVVASWGVATRGVREASTAAPRAPLPVVEAPPVAAPERPAPAAPSPPPAAAALKASTPSAPPVGTPIAAPTPPARRGAPRRVDPSRRAPASAPVTAPAPPPVVATPAPVSPVVEAPPVPARDERPTPPPRRKLPEQGPTGQVVPF